ncbi:E3 ubiquitin-protein ligase RNF170-like [Strigops habroptila]|uniref:E3 ubiquitin-protein ligase RNF170-like n=1 Tax=Strigops habroptila TaxID=2489341 RepID=UPI0011D02F55|nr:E3 ubiquitin-protein ligase RNF170-like [Strigops habroptila]
MAAASPQGGCVSTRGSQRAYADRHARPTEQQKPAASQGIWSQEQEHSQQGGSFTSQDPIPQYLSKESLQIWQPCNPRDFSCPICLQTATLPVETNCGHLFCGSCLITYWKHSPWLAAITCPLCRQKVVLLDNISCEKQHDKPSKQIVHDIRDYNKRFSGQPRPFADYLYDMPLFLTLALRGIFTWGGLVWLFFLRVAVCSFGTIICLSSPFDMRPGPLCRTLGTADDMVVVSLLLICMINICQQIAPNGVNMARSAAQSMLSEA